jgi:hypothetical protein
LNVSPFSFDSLLSPGCRFLLNPDLGDDPLRLAAQAALDGTVHKVPGLIPTDPQYLGGSLDGCLPQDDDSELLEQKRKSGMRFSPRQSHLSNSVLRPLAPGWPCVQKRLELAAIQVAPHLLLRMVVQSSLDFALGTRAFQILGMLNPTIKPLRLDIQLNLRDRPWFPKSQHMLIEIGILHDSPPFGGRVYRALLPTEIPEG